MLVENSGLIQISLTHTTKVVIVADITLYREGLAQILGREEPLRILGALPDLESVLRNIGDLRPDVALIDLSMPESLAAVRAIRALAPTVKVIALAVPPVDEDVVACAEAGVAGYVPRDAGIADLIATIHSVGRGELLCSPHVAATLLRRVELLAASHGLPEVESRLTVRESDIVRLLERGCSNKDIARNLGIEVATVKNHVHNILAKLRVHRRSQAAARLRSLHRGSLSRGDLSRPGMRGD